MNDIDERVVNTSHGFNWGWPSRAGKRKWLRVIRMASFPTGRVLGIDTGDPDKGPRLQVWVSDGCRSIRVWRDGVELVEVDGNE